MAFSKQLYLSAIQKLKDFVNMPRSARMLSNPMSYLISNFIRRILYPIQKSSLTFKVNTVFGFPLTIPFPASNDIYLSGGKTHSSEIRFAEFCIQNFKEGDSILDIGAHIGYYACLFANLVGEKGRVIALEPSPETFQFLKNNTTSYPQVECCNVAVSDANGEQIFYVFPSRYSEYNSFCIEKWKQEKWFQKFPPVQHTLPTIELSSFCREKGISPNWIKIDVEGAEHIVISSISSYLKEVKPNCIIEVMFPESEEEISAIHSIQSQFNELNYSIFAIQKDASLLKVPDIYTYITQQKIDSENLICIPS